MVYPGTFAHLHPHRPAAILAGSGQVLTYAELDTRSIQLARYLFEKGLRRGDHIAVVSDNDLRIFQVYWAALRSGLYITAVNCHLTPAETAHIVDDCDARVLIVSARLGDLVEQMVASTPGVEHRLAFGGPVAGYDDYDAALAAHSMVAMSNQPRGVDMLYSSGTTGRPKGIKVPLPDRQVHKPGDAMLALFRARYGFADDTVYLSPAPLYHAAPLRLGGMVQSCGGTVIVMERFDAAAALELIQRYRVTHSQWVPTMLVRMLKLPAHVRSQYDVSSLRVAIHAAAPCPVEVKEQMIDWWGPVLEEYYASTEAAGLTMISSVESLSHPGSVGRDGFLGIAHICAADGSEVPLGETGTIYFEREQAAFQYHKDPDKTRAAQHPLHPNWMTTGDIGYLDSDRYLYLTDRASFMIICGGVNIYPQEVENCLTLHPSVLDVAVVGLPDPELGEVVLAVVQPAAGVTVGAALERELLDYAAARVARYKLPRRIEFVDELPRTPTGKMLKHTIRQSYA